jgi:hypothetical protein
VASFIHLQFKSLIIMAKQTRAMKERQVASPKGDDWLLRFIRHHSLGVALLAFLSAGGGWLVWHSRDCMTDQKAQVGATRKAWMNFRIAHQKYTDDVDTFITRLELDERNEGRADSYEALDQHRTAIFELSKIIGADCNDVKAATYELERQLKELGRIFPFFAPAKMSNDPESCGRILREAERLRFFEVTGGGDSDVQRANSDASLSELKSGNLKGRELELEIDRNLESFLVRLENMSFVSRVKQYF